MNKNITVRRFTPPDSEAIVTLRQRQDARLHELDGRLLVGHTLHTLAAHDIVGFYLYYVLTNPLSSRFWPKMGFRPLLVTYKTKVPLMVAAASGEVAASGLFTDIVFPGAGRNR